MAFITRAVFYVNYCINFFLYSITGAYFRRELRMLFVLGRRKYKYGSCSHSHSLRSNHTSNTGYGCGGALAADLAGDAGVGAARKMSARQSVSTVECPHCARRVSLSARGRANLNEGTRPSGNPSSGSGRGNDGARRPSSFNDNVGGINSVRGPFINTRPMQRKRRRGGSSYVCCCGGIRRKPTLRNFSLCCTNSGGINSCCESELDVVGSGGGNSSRCSERNGGWFRSSRSLKTKTKLGNNESSTGGLNLPVCSSMDDPDIVVETELE